MSTPYLNCRPTLFIACCLALPCPQAYSACEQGADHTAILGRMVQVRMLILLSIIASSAAVLWCARQSSTVLPLGCNSPLSLRPPCFCTGGEK